MDQSIEFEKEQLFFNYFGKCLKTRHLSYVLWKITWEASLKGRKLRWSDWSGRKFSLPIGQ